MPTPYEEKSEARKRDIAIDDKKRELTRANHQLGYAEQDVKWWQDEVEKIEAELAAMQPGYSQDDKLIDEAKDAAAEKGISLADEIKTREQED